MNANWQTKPVLVTGAGGFIGSHLVEILAREGAQVRAFVRYNSRGDPGLLRRLPPDLLQAVELVPGDLRDPGAVASAVKGCKIVFHLGALISIPYSYIHPFEVAETNFMGTLNLLEACRQEGVDRLIHTSTSEVYGSARKTPMDESHILQAQSPYSASKIGADKLVESYYCTYELPVVTVRPFNTFGPHQSARAVLPTIITQALSGDVIRLGSLDTIRDFTYVDDTVRGFLQAGSAGDVEGGVFNLGTGRETGIREAADLIAQRMDHEVTVEVDLQRLRPGKSEVQRLVSDNKLARERLGWSPRLSFEEGLNLTIAWIRDNLDSYRVGRYEF